MLCVPEVATELECEVKVLSVNDVVGASIKWIVWTVYTVVKLLHHLSVDNCVELWNQGHVTKSLGLPMKAIEEEVSLLHTSYRM